MKERFQSILNTNKKRRIVPLIGIILLMTGTLGFLTACTTVNKDSQAIKPATIYSIGRDGKPIIVNDAGNSYTVKSDGTVSVSYRNGARITETPLKLDITGKEPGWGESNTGFFLSEYKTAIVYGFGNGSSSSLHVLISNDMGKSWNDYEIPESKGYDTKFIGFTTKNDGWLVSGGSSGVGRSLNYVYQTLDGGKTWTEIGNPNELYSE